MREAGTWLAVALAGWAVLALCGCEERKCGYVCDGTEEQRKTDERACVLAGGEDCFWQVRSLYRCHYECTKPAEVTR